MRLIAPAVVQQTARAIEVAIVKARAIAPRVEAIVPKVEAIVLARVVVPRMRVPRVPVRRAAAPRAAEPRPRTEAVAAEH